MSSTATVQDDVAQRPKRVRARPTPSARYLFVIAAVTMLAIMAAGFYPYYLRGEGLAGRIIAPQLATLVFVHSRAGRIAPSAASCPISRTGPHYEPMVRHETPG